MHEHTLPSAHAEQDMQDLMTRHLSVAVMQVAKCLNLSAYKVAQHHRAALAVLQSSESMHYLASVF